MASKPLRPSQDPPVNTRVATMRPTVIWKRMEKSIQRVDSVCVFTMMAAGTHGG